MRRYHAIIWIEGQTSQHILLTAESLRHAKEQVEVEYGEGCRYALTAIIGAAPESRSSFVGREMEQGIQQAIVWVDDQPGQRVTLVAESLDVAREWLEAEYGEECRCFVWNEPDQVARRCLQARYILNGKHPDHWDRVAIRWRKAGPI